MTVDPVSALVSFGALLLLLPLLVLVVIPVWLVSEPRPSKNIIGAKAFTESLVLAETGFQAGSIQIAGTDQLIQILTDEGTVRAGSVLVATDPRGAAALLPGLGGWLLGIRGMRALAIPAAIARQWADRLSVMMVLASLIGAACCTAGQNFSGSWIRITW